MGLFACFGNSKQTEMIVAVITRVVDWDGTSTANSRIYVLDLAKHKKNAPRWDMLWLCAFVASYIHQKHCDRSQFKRGDIRPDRIGFCICLSTSNTIDIRIR